ncbi:EthD domain-containing protein [Ciceribacter sp. RN22]|uniref:EthD domain-containing protein n=1 Tax=Ciceribacter sp. RN22 TaxID=2954932 RepID=UPI002093032C|nr:EthD domain-containing protein [Ciceribacter sp. RN22]MCO6179583.1 EthD domain-containing protein [Ciceribacter sp. RN22]
MTIKTMICGRRRLGQTLGENRAHMKDHHGRLVLDYIAREPSQAPRRYVQNHVFDGIYFGGDGQPRALSLGLDFVTEVWFPDMAAAKSSRETPFYLEQLQPDEPKMVDETSVLGLPVTEELILPPGLRDGAVKVFLFWFNNAPDVKTVPDAANGADFGLFGQCRNLPLFPGPVEAVDEFWLPDEAAGLAFAQACRDAAPAFAPSDTRYCLAIAREHVLHAG